MSSRCRVLLATAALVAQGCGGAEQVVRVVDGRRVAGEFVPAEAYAAYLRGAIADAAGDLDGAIEGYAIAAALGPRDPEPQARLGDARCRKEPRDPGVDEAIGRALSIDGSYAPALEARARCAERRGDVRLAVESARRAMAADASAVEPLATLARVRAPGEDADSEELRARLIAMTLLSGTNAAAWDALATWARGHGDGPLEARALSEVAALAGAPQAEVDSAIARLEGEGEITAARSLARARVEASTPGPIDAHVARLAIDAALLAGDPAATQRSATWSHLAPVVLAARTLLHGDAAGARAIAATLAAAEPGAIAPRLLLAVAAQDHSTGLRAAFVHPVGPLSDAPIPAEVWLPYARAVAMSGSLDGARAVLQAIPREPVIARDSLVTPIAVALAAGGALDAKELDPNGRVELAERRSEPAPDDAIAAADVRHRLLALARRAPNDPKTIALARSLLPERGRDPIVAVAFARLALAGAIDMPPARDLLGRLDPSDPIVAAAVLDCALRAGDAAAIPLARARLSAVAHTPAERARVVFRE